MKYIFLLFIFIVSVGHSQIVINEYSAANVTQHPDGFGEFEDWVELYNLSPNAVDISGWFMSDKAGNIAKFQVQSGIVPGNGTLMVYCSGRAQTFPAGIHTNFKLTQTQPEKFILADNGGIVVDSLTLIPCQRNHSRGRTTDGAGTWSLFVTPTPNAPNNNPQNEYGSRPVMSVPSGNVNAGTAITLTAAGGEDIRYTIDGSMPTVASTLYSAPVVINATTVLRARSFSSAPNTPPSFVETNTYFVGVSHTVPIVSICGDDISDFINDVHPNAFSANFDGAIEMFSAGGVLIDEGEGYYNKHGNDSWAYNQRGIDFKMRDQYGYNYAVKNEIFRSKDRDEYSNLMLKAAANDNYPAEPDGAYIRDAYVQSLSQVGKLKLDERSYEPCILFVDGQYWGLYEIREKVDDNDFLDYYYDQKRLYADAPLNVQFLKTWGATWSEFGGAQSQTDWDGFVNYVTTSDVTDPVVWNYIDSVYNWESLIDYFVLNSYIVSKDWLNWNTAWWRGREPNGDKKKWRYTLWDMDASFGHYVNYTGIPDESPNADPCNAEALPDPGGQGHTVILNALMDNEVFYQAYVSRYIDLTNTTFSCDFMIGHLDSLINIITPEMPQQIARWGGDMATWQANVQTLRDFINQRCAAIAQGMIDCYNLTGPYEITFDVEPINAGKIDINSITPNNYPFTGSYFGGIDVIIRARPSVGMQFDYWEITDAINPDVDSAKAFFEPTQPQTIIAHFVEEGSDSPVRFDGVYIPNAFSPNGDNQNDFLELFIGRDVLEFKFQIFSRWGELVFETTQSSDAWDGTFKGSALNTGVFVYQIDFKKNDGTREKRAGNITLMR